MFQGFSHYSGICIIWMTKLATSSIWVNRTGKNTMQPNISQSNGLIKMTFITIYPVGKLTRAINCPLKFSIIGESSKMLPFLWDIHWWPLSFLMKVCKFLFRSHPAFDRNSIKIFWQELWPAVLESWVEIHFSWLDLRVRDSLPNSDIEREEVLYRKS